jgi:hypothetical protein
MFVPDPVISLAIKPVGNETPKFSRALNWFKKEDSTFRVHIDRESTCLASVVHDDIYEPGSDDHIGNGRAPP